MASLPTTDTMLSRHDSLLEESNQDINLIKPLESTPTVTLGLFDLPAEVRTHIYELVFDLEQNYDDAFSSTSAPTEPRMLNLNYMPSAYLLPLLTCKRLYHDANLLAFSRTLFVVSNPFRSLRIGEIVSSTLSPCQISSLRHIAFIAHDGHFRLIRNWLPHTLNHPLLNLKEVTIVLHRSNYWHYLFDHNVPLVSMLRCLQGCDKITFVRNNAMIKGTLHTWFNRFVKLILATDAAQRFDGREEHCESTWWHWEHCRKQEVASLSRRPPKRRGLNKEEYAKAMGPLYTDLNRSMAEEEVDSDPRSTNGF